METKKRIIILLILVLLIANSAESGEKPTKEKISGTRMASCLVKVTADPAVLPLDFETINALLRSSGIAGKAAREILGASRMDDNIILNTDLLSSGPASAPAKPSSRRKPTLPGYEEEYYERPTTRRQWGIIRLIMLCIVNWIKLLTFRH